MKQIILLVLLCCMPFGVSAQSQQGYVKTKGRLIYGKVVKGTRLSGVTVIVRGRNAVVSSSNGSFSLPISSNNFYLQNVLKQGYVLTDPDVLNRQYVQSKNPLMLVMETPDEQLEDKLEAMDKIRSTLQSQLSKSRAEIKLLKEQNKLDADEYRKRLQELASQQESNEQLVGEMADRYSKIDYDQLDEFNRRISECILNGRLQEADSLLKTKGDISFRTSELRRHQEANAQAEQDLKVKQKKLEKSIAQVQKDLEDLAQDCYSKFEIFKMQHENDSAAYYIEHRAGLDTMNIEWLLDAGGFALNVLADLKRAEYHYNRALANALSLGSQEWTAFSYNDLAVLYSHRGDFEKAINTEKKSLEMSIALYGCDNLNVAENCNNLGFMYGNTGNFTEAEKYVNEALRIGLAVCGEDCEVVSSAYNSLAMINHIKGNSENGIGYMEKSINIFKRLKGENDRYTATGYNNLGQIYLSMKDYKRAMELQQKALEIRINLFGEEHPEVATSYLNIGGVYREQHQDSMAVVYFKKAQDIFSQFYGDEHPDVAYCLSNIGSSYASLGKYEESLNTLRKALDIRMRCLGEKNPEVASTLNNIGYTMDAMKNYSEAIKYYNKSLAIRLEIFGNTHPLISVTYYNLGSAYESLGDKNSALSAYKNALKSLPDGHPNIKKINDTIDRIEKGTN